ncbi:hypothetical protein BDY21DRAFT_45087 [Lineolata rhizophorae]|uniref:GIT Spa2 homology (SHD) domain-containing protein n=1 Tax=Lineolata rhizophorae TaxID=578093 RepID=A0A6A6NZ43_9PEZI|nr:hypothetical protein BDY21DRAFT_45087 [Lineolata rhizophorae]
MRDQILGMGGQAASLENPLPIQKRTSSLNHVRQTTHSHLPSGRTPPPPDGRGQAGQEAPAERQTSDSSPPPGGRHAPPQIIITSKLPGDGQDVCQDTYSAPEAGERSESPKLSLSSQALLESSESQPAPDPYIPDRFELDVVHKFIVDKSNSMMQAEAKLERAAMSSEPDSLLYRITLAKVARQKAVWEANATFLFSKLPDLPIQTPSRDTPSPTSDGAADLDEEKRDSGISLDVLLNPGSTAEGATQIRPKKPGELRHDFGDLKFGCRSFKIYRMRLERFLAINEYPLGRTMRGRNPKLSDLSRERLWEVLADVHDEAVRRETARLAQTYPDEGIRSATFLPAHAWFHPKRNIARRNLSILPLDRFCWMLHDLAWEIDTRKLTDPQSFRRLSIFYADDQRRHSSELIRSGQLTRLEAILE